ncbi:MAG: hypothetical protein Fur0037_17560 [Planctomycetota bacterium]
MTDKPTAQSGFTLIELMIVVSIIAVIAGVAIPNLLSSRAMANDRAILSTLRTIATAQAQCRQGAHVDLDGDGQAEALTLQELAGSATLRGSASALRPPMLSASLGDIDADGHLNKHGYLLALFLPDASGTGLAATAANLASIDPDLSESYWSCVAWPADRVSKVGATYFVNQIGEILMCKNSGYMGKTAVPPAGAALIGVAASQVSTSQLAAGVVGADGHVWMPVQ